MTLEGTGTAANQIKDLTMMSLTDRVKEVKRVEGRCHCCILAAGLRGNHLVNMTT